MGESTFTFVDLDATITSSNQDLSIWAPFFVLTRVAVEILVSSFHFFQNTCLKHSFLDATFWLKKLTGNQPTILMTDKHRNSHFLIVVDILSHSYMPVFFLRKWHYCHGAVLPSSWSKAKQTQISSSINLHWLLTDTGCSLRSANMMNN